MTSSLSSPAAAWEVAGLTLADIPGIVELEGGGVSAWNEKQLQDELAQPNSLQFVARNQAGSICGFACGRLMGAGDTEILRLVVRGNCRRQGLGLMLLGFLLERLRQAGGRRCFLEFRESNGAARGLYEKSGFILTGRRKNYYRSPAEDALLMVRALE